MEEEEIEKNSPLRFILAIFLILLLVLWLVPYYSIKIDPRPVDIPTINDVGTLDNFTGRVIVPKSRSDYSIFINASDPVIKTIAGRIISFSCPKGSSICQAKALYYFVRNNFNYISDPIGKEYVEEPKLFYASQGGDCESGTILLANLMESIGIKSEIVFIPNHALLRIYLKEASKGYKRGDWIYLDWTCSDCDFGEVTPRVSGYITTN